MHTSAQSHARTNVTTTSRVCVQGSHHLEGYGHHLAPAPVWVTAVLPLQIRCPSHERLRRHHALQKRDTRLVDEKHRLEKIDPDDKSNAALSSAAEAAA
jgi:hypothetical protein